MKVVYEVDSNTTLMIVSFRFVSFCVVSSSCTYHYLKVLTYLGSSCLRRNRHSPALEYSKTTLGYLIRLGGREGTWEWSGHVSSGLYLKLPRILVHYRIPYWLVGLPNDYKYRYSIPYLKISNLLLTPVPPAKLNCVHSKAILIMR